MMITVALTGVCAIGNPPVAQAASKRSRTAPARSIYVDVPRLVENPAIGIRGSEIPNNSPPSKAAA